MLKVKFVDLQSEYFIQKTMSILQKHFGEVVECDNPDFLFYSVFGYEHLKYNCVRIQWIGENLRPDFNICDYAIGFDHMEFGDRYVRIPLYYFYAEDYERAITKHLRFSKQQQPEKKFCNFVYSNSAASPEREVFFNMLSRYKKVDSGGRYINNIGGPVSNKYEFQKGYKFSIAFENSSTDGYVTEKILQAFAAGTIPIYWGSPTVSHDFNERAFINCHNYFSFDDVIKRVIELDNNDELYYQLLSEPIGTPSQFPDNPFERYEEFLVHICSQKPSEAIRRSNIMYGKAYQEEQKKFRFGEEGSNLHRSVFYRGLRKVKNCLVDKLM